MPAQRPCLPRVSGEVAPARAQMATTLGFHIILACLGIALPSIVLLAEFVGLRRNNETAMRLARRWSQAMGVLIAVGAVTGTVLPSRWACCGPD
jgi:cytochrome bd ubiquinol oxidase subunit I